jgi:hypothetical protein
MAWYKRGGIGQTRRLRRDEVDSGLLGLLLRDEQVEITCRTQGIELLRQPQRFLCGTVGGSLRRQGLRVVIERAQHVGDFAQRLQDGLPVVGGGGVESRFGGAHLGAQATIEQGLRQLSRQAPDQRTAIEQAGGGKGLRAEIGAQRDTRIQPGHGHPALRAGGGEQGLGGLDVRALAGQLGGQADR